MSVGYASINSISLDINGLSSAKTQNGIFITDVYYKDNVDADHVNSIINRYYQSNLDSSIVLSNTNGNSSITYTITIYNSHENNYMFDGVEFLIGNDTYSNEDITFKLNGLELEDRLDSGDSVTFDITFYYVDNIVSDVSNILTSLLNFKFVPLPPDILYDLVAFYSEDDDSNVDFKSVPTESNSKIYSVSSTKNDTCPVYYYRGVLDNNNVVFAGFCWQIVRTTETCGVKIIYNGPVGPNNTCLDNRDNHIGYGNIAIQTLNNSYYYGTDYTYDSVNKTFSLAGDLNQETWNNETSNSLIGKFTCKSTTSNGSCTTLYQLVSYVNETDANAMPLNASTAYGYIGMSKYNTNDNLKNTSPADSGWMYDTRYQLSSKVTSSKTVITKQSTSSSSNYYYGNTISIDDSGKYVLQNKTLNDDGTYTVSEPTQKVWSSNYSKLKGYYTCRTTNKSCSTVYYIVASDKSNQYTISLNSGKYLEDYIISIGNSIVKNNDGTFTLQDVTNVGENWYTSYSNYIGKYVCNDYVSTTCTDVYQIMTTSNVSFTYYNGVGDIYSNNVSWDGEKYTLVDTMESNNGWMSDKTTLAKKHHYTCFTPDGICPNGEVYYVVDFELNSPIYYFKLTNGQKIDDILNEMFTHTTSSKSSEVKLQMDAWYEKYMTQYTNRLEDTIWCNDRTFYTGALAGLNSNGVNQSNFVSYHTVLDNVKPSLICTNKARDGFTTSTNSGGNGLLKYPVGLITADELLYAGANPLETNSNYCLSNGQNQWTMSPGGFSSGATNNASIIVSLSNGLMGAAMVKSNIGVRPTISLAYGEKISSGKGTQSNPYIIN